MKLLCVSIFVLPQARLVLWSDLNQNRKRAVRASKVKVEEEEVKEDTEEEYLFLSHVGEICIITTAKDLCSEKDRQLNCLGKRQQQRSIYTK